MPFPGRAPLILCLCAVAAWPTGPCVAQEEPPKTAGDAALAWRKAALGKLAANLKLGPVTLEKSAFRKGEAIVATCRLTNEGGEPLRVPVDHSFRGKLYLLGRERWWVERLGPDPVIRHFDREERLRQGRGYLNGEGVIQAWRTMETQRLVTPRELRRGETVGISYADIKTIVIAPGEGVELRQGNKVTGLQPGRYEIKVEFLTLEGKLLAEAKAVFEVN